MGFPIWATWEMFSQIVHRWENYPQIGSQMTKIFPDGPPDGEIFSQMRPKIDTSDFMKSRDFAMRS
jgi:hypothetical protein